MFANQLHKVASRTRKWPVAVKFGCSSTMIAAIVVLEYALWSGHGYPFVLSIVSVVVSSALFGRTVGVYATTASALASMYFFVEPLKHVGFHSIDELLALISFIVIGLGSSFLISAYHEAALQLAERNHQLELANTQLRAADGEKDTLLQELAHRAKNDLSMIVAMINLERRRTSDAASADALDAISNRIRVLSRLQDRLTRDQGEAVVNSRLYFSDLCDDLMKAFAEIRPVRIEIDVEDHPLSQQRAVAIGLIINELLTNALKYAFPGDRSGTVRISFTREADRFCLAVTDDGVGFDPTARPTGSGLGQRLLKSLAVQLAGSIEIGAKEDAAPFGTTATVRFPH